MLGPLMIDLRGLSLNDEEKQQLTHSLVGGVILFTRNFESVNQIRQLVADIRAIRSDLIIAVDHEGGRVQRFREGFTRIPPMRLVGELHWKNAEAGRQLANNIGYVIGRELAECDIDLAFSPVLDLDVGISEIIGDRAFDQVPSIVSDLAQSLIEGMSKAGMAAVGKHYPGHGGIAEDSHVAMPVDKRDFTTVANMDFQPFEKLIKQRIPALMAAHVIFPDVCDKPAGFSSFWINEMLRKQLAYDGVVFTDDLSMEGAVCMGSFTERAEAALSAGCDMAIVCNTPEATRELLANLKHTPSEISDRRLRKLRADTQVKTDVTTYQQAVKNIEKHSV